MSNFKIWEPFSGITPPEAFHHAFREFAKSSDANAYILARRMIFRFLTTYASKNRAVWMTSEFNADIDTITEYTGHAASESTHKSSFRSDIQRFLSVHTDCNHADLCLCHNPVGSDGGIPDFPTDLLHAGKKRKENIQMMHDLLVQFLIYLCEYCQTKFEDYQKMRFQQTIRLSNPKEDEFKITSGYTDIEEWRRETFFDLDSALQIILQEKIRMKPCSIYMALSLACIIARRILALNIAFKGIGYIFARKDAIQYWDLPNMLRDVQAEVYSDDGMDPCSPKYLKESARAAVEQPRYPFRVINVASLEIEEDVSVYRDCYAILSHTWSTIEVLYADLKKLLKRIRKEKDLLAPKGDFKDHEKKLMGAVHSARRLKYAYIWLDNCCIDKANLTGKHVGELAESIPNMGDWYQNAQICIVYLDDFTGDNLDKLSASKTQWATRGWTLQEIVMSKGAVFYNKAWKRIGDSKDSKVRSKLADICNVPQNLLCRGGPPEVAASLILYHASTRKTFKPEDRAYSVLGMLRVRIVPDYGEGFPRALERLFAAVLQTTGDVTIFNWAGCMMQSASPRRSLYPADFKAYGNVDVVQKPASATSPIRVDYVGVNAKFDTWGLEEIMIGNDNERTLSMLRKLVAGLRMMGTKRLDDIVTEKLKADVYLTLKGGTMLHTTVLHEIGLLIKILETEITAGSKTWALARFSGLRPMADWWLCEMNNECGSGVLYGRRVAADDLDQVGILENEIQENLQQRDIWIT